MSTDTTGTITLRGTDSNSKQADILVSVASGAALVSDVANPSGIARNRFISALTGILPVNRQSAVTITIATPGVVSWVAHGFALNTPIVLSTTGALPTGLTAGTTYYVTAGAADTFQLSATVGGAAIATSGTQSGAHTATGNNGVATWLSPGVKGVIIDSVRVVSGTLTVTANADWTVRYAVDAVTDAAAAILLPITPNTSSATADVGQVGSFCLEPILLTGAQLILPKPVYIDVTNPITRFDIIHNIGTTVILQFGIRAVEEV